MEQKIKPKIIRFKPSSDLFWTYEWTHADGTIFRSAKEMHETSGKKGNLLVYCPKCKNGVRYTESHLRNLIIAPVLNINRKFKERPAYMHGESLAITAEWECPYCKNRVELENLNGSTVSEETGTYYTFNLQHFNSNGYISSKTYQKHELDSIRYWPAENGKMAFEIRENVISPMWLNGFYKLSVNTVRYRIVFNLETGYAYLFRGIDLNGKPSKYSAVTNARINTVPIFNMNNQSEYENFLYFFHLMGRNGANIVGRIIKVLEDETGIKCDPYMPFLSIYLQGMDDEQFSHARYLAEKCNCFFSPSFKKRYRICHKFLKSSSFSMLPKYYQKKSIKKRILKNPISIAFYGVFYGYGFRDVNILNNLVDMMDTYVRSRIENRILTHDIFSDEKMFREMMRWVIKTQGEKEAKVLFTGFMKDGEYYFRDSANAFSQLKSHTDEPIPVIHGNHKELHNKLSYMYNMQRQKNIVIPYEKEELDLNWTYGEYTIVLAKDTHELCDIGAEMDICVGTYGDKAVNKCCTIAVMRHNGKCCACIELQEDFLEGLDGKIRFMLVQLKARSNGICTDVEPIEKWIQEKNINAEHCRDYQRMHDSAQKEEMADIVPKDVPEEREYMDIPEEELPFIELDPCRAAPIKDTLPEEYYWFYNPYENEYGISKMDDDFWNSPFC